MFSMTDENWRKQNKTLASRMKVILRQGLFTDAVLKVQGREFNCHQLILAVGSSFFEKAFYHTFRTADSSSMVINDVTPQAFQCVLNFLYTDNVTFGNEYQAFETYEAADKFKITDLKSECEIYLSELDFRPHSIWSNLERATALEMKAVTRKYLNHIQNNARVCLLDEAFLKASGDVVMKIVQFEKLALSELQLASRVAAWARTKNPKFFKVIMEPYLRHIRFKAMTAKEFCSLIQSQPDLLDSGSSLAILKHLELPHQNNMPAWCSQLPKRIWPAS